MDWFAPKHRRNPNEKVDTLYFGVASGNRTVTRLVKKSRVADSMEATQSYGPGLQRGVGGQIACLILGGMETSLDEIEYILEAQKEKRFVPERKSGEIAAMCQVLAERRNERFKHFRENPSEVPKKRSVRLHLPVGYRMQQTSEPGFKILARI